MAPRSRAAGVRPHLLCLTLGLALGCGSSTQIELLQAQVAALGQQLEELRAEVATRSEAERIAGALETSERRATTDREQLQEALANVESEVARLGDGLDESRASLTEIVLELTETRSQLEGLSDRVSELGHSDPAPDAPVLSSDPDELYRAAYADFEAANYDLALLGFRQYVETFANSEQADDALYWIGECYLSQAKYRQAIQEFNRLASRYPASNRRPSALLRKGFAYLALGETEEGKLALQGVVDTFPESDEAVLAREQLEAIVG